MRNRDRRKGLGRRVQVAALVAVGVAIVLVVWPDPCPIKVSIAAVDPSGIADDSGSDFSLCYLTLSNRTSRVVILDEASVEVEARVENNWELVQASSNDGLGPHGTHEVVALMPSGVKACRARFRFHVFSRPLGERMREFSPGLFRGLCRVPVVGPFLLSRTYAGGWRSKSRKQEPDWRSVLTPEVRLPPRPGSGTDQPTGNEVGQAASSSRSDARD